MARIVFTSLADTDTATILADPAAKAGKLTAAKFNNLFEQLYLRLSRYPLSGA